MKTAIRENEDNQAKMSEIIPYACVYIDAGVKEFVQAGYNCFKCHRNRNEIIEDLKDFWTNSSNQNYVLPCLAVRTGLDLFLQVKAFPPGSEVIMSAVNIPDMVRVVKHHDLKIVPLDVSIDTMEPKTELLPALISEKTVAILVAHIFGKWIDMDPIISFAKTHNIAVIEDCAESFCGFDRLSHPATDIALFSFGVIKFSTAFGGAIAKVKDEGVYEKMVQIYNQCTTQRRREYLKKILKYFFVYIFLNVPSIIKPAMYLTRTFNIDHKKIVVTLLRGFPDQMMQRIKQQPSTALLYMLRERFRTFSHSDFNNGQVKGEYVRERLPWDTTLVGTQAIVNNYWLFPILVENPDNVQKILNALGVDAYRGATQLNIIEPEKDPTSASKMLESDPGYPSEARYLIDHVVYLPVHKNVPFHVLDRICNCLQEAMKLSKDSPKVTLHAKL